MSEGALRWKARIASLRWISLIVIIIVGIMLIVMIGELITAVKNPGAPQAVAIEEVVTGPIGANQYVTLEGFAMYEVGYEQTEDDVLVASYYLLIDDLSGHLVVVKASTAHVSDRLSDWASVSGITHKTPSDLRDLIQSDIADFQTAGFMTTSDIYLAEDESPAGVTESASRVIVLGVVGIVSVVPFLFPVTIFAPKPVEWITGETSPPKERRSGVHATGNFLQLSKMEPTIELGKQRRKFTSAAANIIPTEHGELMIYIYHVLRYNFVPISKTHWGVFLNSRGTGQVEPGVVYGWKDRPAIRFNYVGDDNKPETLLLTFDHAMDQVDCLKSVREMGFNVVTGFPAANYP
jgi:hypothetical protein